MRLYEINDGIEEILSRAAESGGELTDADLEALAELELAWPQKVESVALYIRTKLAEAEVVGAEEERLADRRKAITKQADGLKEYLRRQMEERGEAKVAGRLVTVAVQNSTPSVRVLCGATALPPSYQRVIPAVPESVEADKRAILDAYKAGAELPEGVEVICGTHVRIR